MSASNAPRDYYRAPQPIPVPERDTVIPSFYNASDHDDNLEATVTQNGMPVAVNGEVLTIGTIPPERRFAVLPVADGAAELMPQEAFEQSYKMYLEEDLRSKGGRPAFPQLWPIPTVRNFVEWKIMPHDHSRLVPLGIPFYRENPRPTKDKYDPRLDQIIEALSERAPAVVTAAAVPAAPPVKQRKEWSEEAKQAARERLAKAREVKKAKAGEAPPAA